MLRVRQAECPQCHHSFIPSGFIMAEPRKSDSWPLFRHYTREHRALCYRGMIDIGATNIVHAYLYPTKGKPWRDDLQYEYALRFYEGASTNQKPLPLRLDETGLTARILNHWELHLLKARSELFAKGENTDVTHNKE